MVLLKKDIHTCFRLKTEFESSNSHRSLGLASVGRSGICLMKAENSKNLPPPSPPTHISGSTSAVLRLFVACYIWTHHAKCNSLFVIKLCSYITLCQGNGLVSTSSSGYFWLLIYVCVDYVNARMVWTPWCENPKSCPRWAISLRFNIQIQLNLIQAHPGRRSSVSVPRQRVYNVYQLIT